MVALAASELCWSFNEFKRAVTPDSVQEARRGDEGGRTRKRTRMNNRVMVVVQSVTDDLCWVDIPGWLSGGPCVISRFTSSSLLPSDLSQHNLFHIPCSSSFDV